MFLWHCIVPPLEKEITRSDLKGRRKGERRFAPENELVLGVESVGAFYKEANGFMNLLCLLGIFYTLKEKKLPSSPYNSFFNNSW